MREPHARVSCGRLFAERPERAVVVDDAVLQDLDQRRAPMRVRAHQNPGHMVLQRVDAAGHERCARAKREERGVDRPLDRSAGRGGRTRADRRGRRILTLGQAVDGVVQEQQIEIDVAAEHMQEVVAADRQEVAVAADHPHVEIGIGELHARRHRRRTAVDGVETVACDVVGEARGAADAGDEHDIVRLAADLRERRADALQDRVVAATRAPAYLLVGGEILGGKRNDVHRAPLLSRAMNSASSVDTRNGRPLTCVIGWTGRR